MDCDAGSGGGAACAAAAAAAGGARLGTGTPVSKAAAAVAAAAAAGGGAGSSAAQSAKGSVLACVLEQSPELRAWVRKEHKGVAKGEQQGQQGEPQASSMKQGSGHHEQYLASMCLALRLSVLSHSSSVLCGAEH